MAKPFKKLDNKIFTKKEETWKNRFKPAIYFAALSGFFKNLFAQKKIPRGGGKIRGKNRFPKIRFPVITGGRICPKDKKPGDIETSKRFKRRRIKGEILDINGIKKLKKAVK